MSETITGEYKLPWRRPAYVGWWLITFSAIVLNLAVGNGLWLWYSFIGLAGATTLILLDYKFKWNLPSRLVWWMGIPLAMHYVGGSLAGIHQIGGENGLYYVFPWWDNTVHFLGSGGTAVGFSYLLRNHVANLTVRAMIAGCIGTTIGTFVELYEFIGFIRFGTIDQGFYTNTLLDLYYNALGAFFMAWVFTVPRRVKSPTLPTP